MRKKKIIWIRKQFERFSPNVHDINLHDAFYIRINLFRFLIPKNLSNFLSHLSFYLFGRMLLVFTLIWFLQNVNERMVVQLNWIQNMISISSLVLSSESLPLLLLCIFVNVLNKANTNTDFASVPYSMEFTLSFYFIQIKRQKMWIIFYSSFVFLAARIRFIHIEIVAWLSCKLKMTLFSDPHCSHICSWYPMTVNSTIVFFHFAFYSNRHQVFHSQYQSF